METNKYFFSNIGNKIDSFIYYILFKLIRVRMEIFRKYKNGNKICELNKRNPEIAVIVDVEPKYKYNKNRVAYLIKYNDRYDSISEKTLESNFYLL